MSRPHIPSTKNEPSASPHREGAAAVVASDPPRGRARRDPLVGCFFHSFHPQTKYPDAPTPIVNWQGHVLGRADEHTYLIELFSWMDGAPNGQQLQSIVGMSDWKFYPSAEAMNDWYENEYCPRLRHYEFGVQA